MRLGDTNAFNMYKFKCCRHLGKLRWIFRYC